MPSRHSSHLQDVSAPMSFFVRTPSVPMLSQSVSGTYGGPSRTAVSLNPQVR